MAAAETACGTDRLATDSAGGAGCETLVVATEVSIGNGGGMATGRFWGRPAFRGG